MLMLIPSLIKFDRGEEGLVLDLTEERRRRAALIEPSTSSSVAHAGLN